MGCFEMKNGWFLTMLGYYLVKGLSMVRKI